MSCKRPLASIFLQILETPSCPPSLYCLSTRAQKFSTAKQAQQLPQPPKIPISPQTVNPVLLNCPSDLLAMSFFMWCARQPHYFYDRFAFNHMVGIAHRLTGRFKTVKGIVSQLESVGCVIKAQTFLLLLRIYWRGGMYSMVFEAFEEMCRFGYTPNVFARNVIMDVLFRIGRVDVALAVLDGTVVPNFLTFNTAVCNLCKLRDLDNVQKVSRIILRMGYRLNVETFLMVLNCFCKMGKLAKAFQILAVMITTGTPISVAVWSVLIDAFCKSHRLHVAAYLLEKMVNAGSSPTVVTYTSLIKGYLESHMFNSAFNILSTMESKGCAPDLVLYNVLIDCLSKIERHDDAIEVFCGLPKQKLIPDSYTFSSILSTICMCRRFSLFPELTRGFVMQADLVMCNLLLSYFCKAGLPLHAVEFYNDLVDSGLEPDSFTFVGLLQGLCGAGRIDEALNVYRGIVMNHSGLDAHVHTVIISELIKVGKFHRAIRLFRKAVVKNYPLDVVTYTAALVALFRSARFEEARVLYHQMKEAGISPNTHTYNVMLCGFCEERDYKIVERLLLEMIALRLELHWSTYMKMSKILCQTHNSQPVSNLLHEMLVLGLLPDITTCAFLFKEFSEVEMGDSPLFQMLSDGLQVVDVSDSNEDCGMIDSVG